VACRGGCGRCDGRRHPPWLASKGPVFVKNVGKWLKKEEKNVVTACTASCTASWMHQRSELLWFESWCEKVTNLAKWPKKGRQKFWEMNRKYSRASKNLLGSGHPIASARNCSYLIFTSLPLVCPFCLHNSYFSFPVLCIVYHLIHFYVYDQVHSFIHKFLLCPFRDVSHSLRGAPNSSMPKKYSFKFNTKYFRKSP